MDKAGAAQIVRGPGFFAIPGKRRPHVEGAEDAEGVIHAPVWFREAWWRGNAGDRVA